MVESNVFLEIWIMFRISVLERLDEIGMRSVNNEYFQNLNSVRLFVYLSISIYLSSHSSSRHGNRRRTSRSRRQSVILKVDMSRS